MMQVSAYLRGMGELAIKDETIATLAAEEVDGIAFVGLTLEMLRGMGLKTGAISKVMQAVDALKGPAPPGAPGAPKVGVAPGVCLFLLLRMPMYNVWTCCW